MQPTFDMIILVTWKSSPILRRSRFTIKNMLVTIVASMLIKIMACITMKTKKNHGAKRGHGSGI